MRYISQISIAEKRIKHKQKEIFRLQFLCEHIFPVLDAQIEKYGLKDKVWLFAYGPLIYKDTGSNQKMIKLGFDWCAPDIVEEEAAREILADFMKATKCILGDLQPKYKSTLGSTLEGEYEAIGRINDYPVVITLDVPWIPKKCVTKQEIREQTYTTVICN